MPLRTDLPLFCFGSLMDAEVMHIVSGCALAELDIIDAQARDHVQREVHEESYPILMAAPGQSARGRLVRGLDQQAMDRILFFEGDEYTLDTLQVHTDDGAELACWFRDTGAYQDTGREWSFEQWREQARENFIDTTRRYMTLYGRMTATEADAHWQQLTACRLQST